MTNAFTKSEASITAIAGGNFDRLLSYSEKEWEFFRRCSAALDGIKLLEGRSRARSLAVNRVAVELGVNRSTVYHWLNKYDGDIVRLFPKSPGPSRGTICLSLEHEAAIQVGIKREYLSDQKISVAELVRRIGKICDSRGLDWVSRHAVQQRIDRLDQHMVARKRGELLRAEDLTLRPGTHVVSWPFERWQIDHTEIDVMVLSSIDGQVLGRPYVTLIIDVATRMVAGYCLSWDAPGARSVAMALVCAVGTKEQLLERLGLCGRWPVFGLPFALHSDNAGEFAKSVAYRRGCDRYKIGREFRDQGKPRDGGHIERLIGTFMARCHFLPGTTFSNIRQREKYNSAAKARLTIAEVEAELRRRRLQNEGPAKGHLVIEAIKRHRTDWERSQRLSKRDRLTRERIAEGCAGNTLDRGEGAVSSWAKVMRGAR